MKRYYGFWQNAVGLVCCYLVNISPVGAQIAGDTTLSTAVTSPDGLNYTILNGTPVDTNLFHSFSQFSVPTGGSAFFDNALEVENIIGRVTGGSLSNIDGLIRTNGTANLFLLNPSGIIFGANAQLNIGGSFIASTANGMRFADGTEFTATTASPPLLTLSVPIGLQYGSTAAGIQVQGSTLEISSGRSLALVGGDIAVVGGNLTAARGRIELGAVRGAGTVEITFANNQIQFTVPDAMARADISLTDDAVINTSGIGGGDIQLTGKQITLQDARVESTTLGSQPGGNLTVNATDAVKIVGNDDAGGMFTQGLFAETRGAGTGGNLSITTGELTVQGEARISAATFGAGQGGNLTVNAADSVELIGVDSNDFQLFTGILTDTERTGAAGDLMINTRRLIVREGAQVSAATFGEGVGGNLTVNATESVELIGVSASDLLSSGLFTATQPEATGNAGNLEVNTRKLIVQDGAQIFAGTGGAGDGGNLTVNAADFIEVSGVSPIVLFPSGLFTVVEATGTGNAGDLEVNTGRLTVQDGGQISASTFGVGNGGNLTVNAADSVEVTGVSPDLFPSGLFSTADDFPLIETGLTVGNAGDLTVNTRQLIVQDGGQIAASTFGNTGEGGNLLVNAVESVDVRGTGPEGAIGGSSGLLADATDGFNDSGTVTVNTEQLRVEDDARVAVSNQGTGNAGNLEVKAGSIFLDNQGTLTAETASGEGGNIKLELQNLLLMRRNSLISAEAGGTGNGGNIDMDTTFLVAFENSDIIANAFEGRGGNVQITAQGIVGIEFCLQNTPESCITVSSEFGEDGVVVINTPDVDPSKELVTLSEDVLDVSNLVAQGCGAGQGGNLGEFIVTGRGGLPPSPGDIIPSEVVLEDLGTELMPTRRNDTSGGIFPNSTPSSPAPIVEAQGWIKMPDGQIILTAQAGNVTPDDSWHPAVTCQVR
ncbi:MAG: S-layer family protein [Coleofasciculus sp. B1-GNL1-01]|uniref:two-partner secretion domain-containing protein n=1 Tax=Coleofasciculus sp. B1-GNL1-01 TaxID=3068484 RepID=UPI0032FC8024